MSKQKEVVEFELENLELSQDPEPILTDLIHAVSIDCHLTAPYKIIQAILMFNSN